MLDRAPLVLIPQFFGCLVFDRRTSRYLPFDAAAAAVLIRLLDEPFERVLADTLAEERRNELIRFYEQFYELGFFALDGRLAGEALRGLEVPPDHLTGPLAVHLEVIASCNLACAHCFAGELPRRAARLTLDEIGRLFREMARLGSFRLGLTGGEPLLRKDIFTIIDLALEHGLAPCVTTNGLLVTERIAREFGRRDLVWLNVSLEGAAEETNDAVRGPGTFAKVMDRLAVLREHTRFTLAFTIMRTNLDEIEACAHLAAAVGADTAVFRPLYPVGVARQHLDLMPTFAEYSTALGQLALMDADLRHIDLFSPFSRRQSQAVTHQNYGCGAGNLVCSVSVSGEVNPCSFLGPQFAAASIRDQPLAEIWHRSAGFRNMRALPPTEPDTGARFAGGCRARALMLNGSVNAPDPWITAHAASPAALHPLAVLDVSAGSCRGACG